jgi:hypothetical protein
MGEVENHGEVLSGVQCQPPSRITSGFLVRDRSMAYVLVHPNCGQNGGQLHWSSRAGASTRHRPHCPLKRQAAVLKQNACLTTRKHSAVHGLLRLRPDSPAIACPRKTFQLHASPVTVERYCMRLVQLSAAPGIASAIAAIRSSASPPGPQVGVMHQSRFHQTWLIVSSDLMARRSSMAA